MKLLFSPAAFLACVLALPGARAGEGPAVNGAAAYATLVNRPLSLQEALNIAAGHNAFILAARKEVEARYGIAIQVRAIVLPKVIANSGYFVRQDSLIEQNQNRALPLPGNPMLPEVNAQTWNNDIRVVQSIYEGGRMASALRQEQLIREQALVDFDTVVADVLLRVRIAYDEAQLAAMQITLREQSVALLGKILDKIIEQRKVGVVTEFEELRAKVEQDNARTPLALARQDYVIAKQRLMQLLGYDVPASAANNLALELSTPLRAPAYPFDLPAALFAAQERRSELISINLAAKLGDEAIIVARAGGRPSVQAFTGYEVNSRTQSRNLSDPNYGFTAGVQVSWPIFDGFLTRGRIAEATAKREQIYHTTDELRRQIVFEVRVSWAQMKEARNILNIQAANINSAIKAEDLANTRYNTGIGSQLEVFSAQTALTDARDYYATALRNYSVAYAQLLRATGEDMLRMTPSAAPKPAPTEAAVPAAAPRAKGASRSKRQK